MRRLGCLTLYTPTDSCRFLTFSAAAFCRHGHPFGRLSRGDDTWEAVRVREGMGSGWQGPIAWSDKRACSQKNLVCAVGVLRRCKLWLLQAADILVSVLVLVSGGDGGLNRDKVTHGQKFPKMHAADVFGYLPEARGMMQRGKGQYGELVGWLAPGSAIA
jgi:hypothetical protein